MKRRDFLVLSGASIAVAAGTPAMALSADQATGLVRQMSDEVLALARAGGSAATMESSFKAMMDRYADMRQIAGISLGRYSRGMSSDQKTRYIAAFKNFIAKTYAGRFSEYSGETIDIGRARPGNSGFLVNTIVNRGAQPALNVDWLVSDRSGSPKVIDFFIEGVSMALSQRGEFVSMIDGMNGDLDRFISDLESRANS